MPQCKSCKAEIIFIKTKKGKSMPCNPGLIDYANAKPGAFLCSADGDVFRVSTKFQDKRGYLSHFATCPNADNFRKDKK